MAFDIHQSILDRDGSPSEKKAHIYQDTLDRLFADSPEGQAREQEKLYSNFTSIFVDFGINYLGITPPQMSPDTVRAILFELFPEKLSALAEEAPNIIHELQLFWQFLQREFHLSNAAACLKILDDKAAHKLQKEMSNPDNFGITKSFIMRGYERGFRMTTQEGIDEWMRVYNAELEAGTGQPIQLPKRLRGLFNPHTAQVVSSNLTRTIGNSDVVDADNTTKPVNRDTSTQRNKLQRKAKRRQKHRKG
jgi:hypothetical protein